MSPDATIADPRSTDNMSLAEYESGWMRTMTEPQRALFAAEMMQARKNDGTAVLLAIFLGGLGIHRFYLKDLTGIIYIVFCWTFIPMVVAFVECLFLSKRVERYNKQQAYLIATRIRAYAGAATVS